MSNENYSYLIIALMLFIGIVILISSGKKWRKKNIKKESIFNALSRAGYDYDPVQDIFFSKSDAWQKEFGYSPIYDEAAAPLSMIIDCEPIKFSYEGKNWLIELWKGQYGMTTGCEIGVYTAEQNYSVSGAAGDIFYESAHGGDQLHMALVLHKNNRILFKREGRHWWLTGFVLGEFSNPHELYMEAGITLKDKAMTAVFLDALIDMGYTGSQMRIMYTTVWLLFRHPLSPQPLTRTPITDALTQKKNEQLCNQYQQLTQGHKNSIDKLLFLWENSPDLFKSVLNMGKPISLFRK